MTLQLEVILQMHQQKVFLDILTTNLHTFVYCLKKNCSTAVNANVSVILDKHRELAQRQFSCHPHFNCIRCHDILVKKNLFYAHINTISDLIFLPCKVRIASDRSN